MQKGCIQQKYFYNAKRKYDNRNQLLIIIANRNVEEKREQILKRDQNSCRNCGGNTGLQVHHRQYHISRVSGEFKHPWEYPSKLLVTLCQKCHEAGHKQYNIPSFKH